MREPAFWWRAPGLCSALLAPLGLAYGAVTGARMTRTGARAGIPVICVGNFTLGGTGKTPTAIALAVMLKQAGKNPFFLTRGYKGSATGPTLVDAGSDTAARVGDEALLLARVAPTVVARDRIAGAAFAQTQGADIVVMDDGLQNGSLAKDFTLAVVDGRRGLGNACVFPAGPLRAPLDTQLSRTDALLVVGETTGARDIVAKAKARKLPVFHARLAVDHTATAELKGRKVLAFAGIGDPEKFFASATEAGIAVAQHKSFPDHHHFTAEETAALMMEADEDGLALLTTEKDRARMTGDPLLVALAERVHVLPVTMAIDDAAALENTVLKAARR
jgi:tetraacyldisaccharide 4'-kinase